MSRQHRAIGPVEPTTLGKALRYHGMRWLPVFVLALLTLRLYPVPSVAELTIPAVGTVAPEEVIAPFTFPVLKSAVEIGREADEFASRVRPIYDFQTTVIDSLLGRAVRFFDTLAAKTLPSEILEAAGQFGVVLQGPEAQYLSDPALQRRFRDATTRMIRTDLDPGVVGPLVLNVERSDAVIVRRGDVERTVARSDLRSRTDYLALDTYHPDPNSAVGDQVFVKVLGAFFAPTLVRNDVETAARMASVRAGVDSVKYRVQANERIIAAHDPVTEVAYDKMLALRRVMVASGEISGTNIQAVFGQLLMDVLVLSVFWLLLMLYIPEVYRDSRLVGVFGALFGVIIISSWLNFRFIHDGAELIPIPFAAIIITVLFSGRIAIVAAMIMAVLLGSQAVYGGADAFLIAVMGGVTAALGVRHVRRRSHILISAAFVAAAFALASLTVELRSGWSLTEWGPSALRGAANATVSASLAFLVLPVFEGMSRITTDMTLLELSDPSRPLLRRLAVEVPGTYAHSVAVANLCEAGCNAIGSNGLLARVGCYYHDVGKMHRPQHFSENQGPGGNPHDRLPPEVSADIIRGHVTEGMRMAEEARLPQIVRDFIPEHHGDREITYFLDKARKIGPVADADLARFRYGGPRPRSTETAVAMIADGVEAVIRVLEDPSRDRVRGAIDHVVKQRLDEGQFDESPLTLGQLGIVKESFVRTLEGMYHNRIEYPEESGGITAHWSAASGA